jgi:hypothetical protein
MIDPSSSEEEDDDHVQHHGPQKNRSEPPGYGHLEVPNATPRFERSN